MAERQFGPYRLVRQIAVGGMAEIHLAKTAGIAGFEKYVALKMIHPNFAEDDQFIQMLVDEAKIAVQLTHGNIAQTFDLGRVGDTYYITMEYVDGADLYKILRRASEQDREMPLDVCAFVGKEISSALDHAHRKRDHVGKSLGIVHRDVSPQNVLVSYAGEVKLVDFGIAKATMKVRQTAVGVIKGKYYYMSPEQAWGDPIDQRSDIFSAGIVLYEMITGQMLYLEEDLHKLLEMARTADIAPPSKLRRGVPPQLERIVMHALAKVPGERYQHAGDLATDLERFLHAYSPVFTASKLSALLRDVIGDPLQVPDDRGFESIEFRDGGMSTHPIDDAEVAHAIDRDELRDENSVIFRMSELDKAGRKPASDSAQPSAPAPLGPPPRRPQARSAARPAASPSVRPSSSPPPSLPRDSRPSIVPRVTRATDSVAIPSRAAAPLPSVVSRSTGSTKIPQVTKPRQPHEETRQLEQKAPANPLHDDNDNSGLLTLDGGQDGAGKSIERVPPIVDDDLDGIGERTLVTTLPSMAFMTDFAGDDDGHIEATVVTAAPVGPGFGEDDATTARRAEPAAVSVPVRSKSAAQPAALSAKIHAPAVSELRKPRTSRRTPATGSPTQSNVLQAIVGSRTSEPMPAPRPTTQPPPVRASPPPLPSHAPPPFPPPPPPVAAPPAAAPRVAMSAMSAMPSQPIPVPQYHHDASGLPLGMPAPGMDHQQSPFEAYAPMQGPPAGYQAQFPPQMSPQGYLHGTPGALYQFPPPQPQPLSLTGQLRAFEVDELPSHYRIGPTRSRMLTYFVAGAAAIALAATATFFVINWLRPEKKALWGSVFVESVPANADVLFDGTKLAEKTPLTIDQAQLGAHHTIRVVLAHYEPYEQAIQIPADGHEITVSAKLAVISGKLFIESTPPNAEIRINGEVRGRTPMIINDVDRDAAKLVLELRLKDYQPYMKDLTGTAWPTDNKLKVSAKLVR